MATDPVRAELLLRRERDGGFVFHPEDATFVHLDTGGFDAVADALHYRRIPTDAAASDLVRDVRAALPGGGTAASRLLELPAVTEDDVGGVMSAPTLMDFQITDSCDQACPQCYAASRRNGEHVDWSDARLAFAAMRGAGVCQVAIGGGEPLRHPEFADILALARDLGMVPNVTTTAIGMTAAQGRALARHCGAVALSLEGVGERFVRRRRQGFAIFEEKVEALQALGVNLVLQVTLSDGNIDELPAIVDYALGITPLYGIIFLAHKPAGRAVQFDRPLAARPFAAVHASVLEAVRALRAHTQVGFDCCLTPLLAALEGDLGFAPASLLEGCSAARGSLGLSPRLDVVPCTFLPRVTLGNLRERSLHDIWRGQAAKAFRRDLAAFAGRDGRCGTCGVGGACLGGCPVWSLVGCRHHDADGSGA